MDPTSLAERIRAFNRFYTETIGALDDKHEGLAVTLVQSRMLYTIATTDDPHVGQLARALHLDLPYASRVLGVLEDRKLIRRTLSDTDRRQRNVELTAAGRRTLAKIEQRSNERVLGLTRRLTKTAVADLLGAMDTIQHLLATEETT
jgi:DNA-binding MarR family transcriptional regulator